MGFAAAVLYFAGYAQYNSGQDSGAREQIASKDFLHYILGRCTGIDDLRELLKTISIVGLEDPVTQTVAPLHWIAVDRSGECVVIEQTERGMEVITNPIGVMSNSLISGGI